MAWYIRTIVSFAFICFAVSRPEIYLDEGDSGNEVGSGSPESEENEMSEFEIADREQEKLGVNKEETGGNCEGDLKANSDDDDTESSCTKIKEESETENAQFRNALGKPWRDTMLWKDGVVPVELSRKFRADEYASNQIYYAFGNISELTAINGVPCITFKQHEDEDDFLFLQRKSGCWSQVARRGGNQTVSLDFGCTRTGTIMHELLHALGFYHEQSRSDRDDYVTIYWNFISSGRKGNFEKYDSKSVDAQEEPYDYTSILHYGPYAFSINRFNKTLVPKENGARIGQRSRLSEIDINKIRKLYKCQEKANNGKSSKNRKQVPFRSEDEDFEETVTTRPTRRPVYTTSARTSRRRTTTTTTEPSITQLPMCKNYENSVFCNFNREKCGFENAGEFDWVIFDGSTPTEKTGPIENFARSYLLAEATGNTKRTAILKSPTIAEKGRYCVEFMYNMWGSKMGNLKVQVEKQNGVILDVGEISGNQGQGWNSAQFSTNLKQGNNVIRLLALVGNRDKADVAIDNLCIRKGVCEKASSRK
ncbi:unnamed protein product [Owenia fusiformis]|uniref:Metalloendopeptidase n=2 Tax=Owenia fusiformis TaxID=6347 RepID=A0A8J1U5C9_OWEFU|nr:unnamed protein product [Owenia fusiformis]